MSLYLDIFVCRNEIATCNIILLENGTKVFSGAVDPLYRLVLLSPDAYLPSVVAQPEGGFELMACANHFRSALYGSSSLCRPVLNSETLSYLAVSY